jgi:[acyl-carrier-protein] S-malonyltransferase
MAVSLAAMRVLEAEAGLDLKRHAAYVAGHSLGEYSALAAAGSLTVGDAARLLRIRGDAMQKAVPEGVGAMAALLGLDLEPVKEIAADAATEEEVCEVANDNAPGQVVVAGHKAAVERAMEIGKGRGARRSMLLAVSAPFHCALMQPAAEVMANALASTKIHAPAVPLVANVLAGPLSDPTEIRRRLVEQVTGTVRWRESMLWLGADGVARMLEIGAGKVLTGLARRIVGNVASTHIGTPDEIRALAAEFQSS